MQDNKVTEALRRVKDRQSNTFRPLFDTPTNPSTPSPFQPLELTQPKPVIPVPKPNLTSSIPDPTPSGPTPSKQVSDYINRVCNVDARAYINMSADDQFYHDLLTPLSYEERVEVVVQSITQGLLRLN
jgi:hypothetical protein